jgi:hypothetical protein
MKTTLKKGDDVASAKFPTIALGKITKVYPAQNVVYIDTEGACGPVPVPFEMDKLVLHVKVPA